MNFMYSPTFFKKTFLTTAFLFLVSVTFAFAQGTNVPSPSGSQTGVPSPSGSQTGVPAPLPNSLVNPLSGVSSINELLVAILNVLIIIATPIIVIFIILAGFKYVTARGNTSQIEEAHRALTYAVIGGVLIIGALALAQIISNLVTAFG